MIWMLALLGCGEKDVDDTGAPVGDHGDTDTTDGGGTDSGGGDGGTTDGGTTDGGTTDGGTTDGGTDSGDTSDGGGDSGEPDPTATLRASEVLVDLELYTPPEGAWEVDVALHGDGVFVDRVARAVVTITPTTSLGSTELGLEKGGTEDLFVGLVGVELPEEGLELEPLVTEGEAFPLNVAPEVSDVEYEEVEELSLPMIGTWLLPESYESPMVFGLVDGATGELILKTTRTGRGGHYPVGAFRLEDGTVVDMHTQTSSWRSGADGPGGALVEGTELQVGLALYDDGGDLVGSVSRTAMYGDIIMGQVALDDFND